MNEKCKFDMIPDSGRWPSFHRCSRPAKKDGYCGTHHPDAVKRRKEKQEARYAAESKAIDENWARRVFNERAGNRCRKLGIQPEEICLPTPN